MIRYLITPFTIVLMTTTARAQNVQTIREATGANAVAVQGTVDAFRIDLGDPVNGAIPGSQGAGRRQINWDAVADADAANGRFPADFFNAVSPRGVIFGGDPRISFQVSADAANPAGTGVRFDNLNGTYDTAFATFSAERLFTPLGFNVMDVEFVVPGSLDPAVVTGFGAVFVDVDVPNTSKIDFFDASNTLLFSRNVLSVGNNDGFLSFLGVTFDSAVVRRVRITCGSSVVLFAGSPNDITQAGPFDIVVLDDFIYGEPQPIPDSDGDGALDPFDGCPNDAAKTAPGVCGCGASDADGDGDGVADCLDGCPNDANKLQAGPCGCGNPDVDTDGDGLLDCFDNCPGDPNPLQEDDNNNGIGNACDATAGQPCPGAGLMTMSITLLGVGGFRRRKDRRGCAVKR